MDTGYACHYRTLLSTEILLAYRVKKSHKFTCIDISKSSSYTGPIT